MKPDDNDKMERYVVALTLMLHELLEVLEEYLLKRERRSPQLRNRWLPEDDAFAHGVTGVLRLVVDAALSGLDDPSLAEVRRPYQQDAHSKTDRRSS